MSTIEVKVPNIGDFKDVEVIELLVQPGDEIGVDQSLVTVESDKASMEIPSAAGGVVKELKVKVGDRVSEGSVIVLLDAAASGTAGQETGEGPTGVGATSPQAIAAANEAAARTEAAEARALAGGPAPGTGQPSAGGGAQAPGTSQPSTGAGARGPAPSAAPVSQEPADHQCQVLVLGGGPGGYSAAFRAADLGLDVILVERYSTLGGVCLNVGCIPSKALLHVAEVIDEARHFDRFGVQFGEPKIDLDALRAHKDKVVAKLTGGLAGMARARKVRVLRGHGEFTDPQHLEVDATEGEGQQRSGRKQRVRFEQAIVAAGSEPVWLPFIPKDPRIVDSTGALTLPFVPKRLLVIGGGIIGLEMASVYSTLGARIEVVEMLEGLMPGADRDLVKVWQKYNEKRFDRVMLNTRTVKVEAKDDGIHAWFEGPQAPEGPQVYDFVLSAVGRRPNGNVIGADRAGIQVDPRGFIGVDRQMRTNVGHIFAIGDIVGQPMLAHKAVHEGHVAAEALAGQKSFFDARVIPSVAYTDPEIAWVGLTEDEAKRDGVKVGRAVFPWAASGRAIANGRDEGVTKLLFDEQTHRIVGGAIVGTHAGDMIGELALAIEMGCDATDIGRTIHPHPTLGESIGMAAEVFEGVCTDLPPARGKR